MTYKKLLFLKYKKGVSTPYKSTHLKHPCVLWLDESYSNFLWLKELALELNREFT